MFTKELKQATSGWMHVSVCLYLQCCLFHWYWYEFHIILTRKFNAHFYVILRDVPDRFLTDVNSCWEEKRKGGKRDYKREQRFLTAVILTPVTHPIVAGVNRIYNAGRDPIIKPDFVTQAPTLITRTLKWSLQSSGWLLGNYLLNGSGTIRTGLTQHVR